MLLGFLIASLLPVVVGATMDLPLNDVNIVVVTDVHSWIGGHRRHEPQWDADYGHVLSFYEHLQQRMSTDKNNLFFVMNGDFMEGTGLSTDPPTQLTPILQKMPWDALNIGNHELYRDTSIQHITNDFGSFWGERYITSNVMLSDDTRPLGGSRYTILKGPTAKLLTFGFLYNMEGHSGLVIVEPVEDVVEQSWFSDALKNEDYDAILCLVHMDVLDELSQVLLSKIRSIVGPDMTVQFISGHSHIRAYEEFDDRSTSLEAGRFLDTVGFVSFNLTSSRFGHAFLPANVKELQSTVGVEEDNDFLTENGRALQQLIFSTQEEMGLTKVVGRSPDRFSLEAGLSDPQSLWRLYMEQVISSYFSETSSLVSSTELVFVQSSGSLRYDLFLGEVTLDDLLAVSPFDDVIFKVADIRGRDFVQVLGGSVNGLQDSTDLLPNLPGYVCSRNDIDPDKMYGFYTADFDLPYLQDRTEQVTGNRVDPAAQSKTTQELWIDYVSKESKKAEQGGSQTAANSTTPATPVAATTSASSGRTPGLLVAVGLAVAVVILAIVALIRRRNAIVGYREPAESSASTAQPKRATNQFV